MGDLQHFNSVRSLADGRFIALQQCTVPSWWTGIAARTAGWPGVGAERVLVDGGDGQGRPPACSRPVHLSIGPQPGLGRPDRPPTHTHSLCKHRRGYHNKSPNKRRHWAIMFLLFSPPFFFFYCSLSLALSLSVSPFFPPPSHRHLCFQSSATGSPSSAQLAGAGRTAAVFAHLNWLHHRHLQFDDNYIQISKAYM